MKKRAISVSLKEYDMDMLRYAAYALSGDCYVMLGTENKDGVTATFEPKPGAAAGDIAKRFKQELEDEKLRSAIGDANRELREFLVLKALSGKAAPAKEESPGLTPAQERELNDLIAQVEQEMKLDAAGKGARSAKL